MISVKCLLFEKKNGLKQYSREFSQIGRGDKKRCPKAKKEGKGRTEATKYKALLFEQEEKIPMIALGDAVFPSTIEATIHVLVRRLLKVLNKAGYEG